MKKIVLIILLVLSVGSLILLIRDHNKKVKPLVVSAFVVQTKDGAEGEVEIIGEISINQRDSIKELFNTFTYSELFESDNKALSKIGDEVDYRITVKFPMRNGKRLSNDYGTYIVSL